LEREKNQPKSVFLKRVIFFIHSIDTYVKRGMLATHILAQTFQHTIFDWLKFTWVPPNVEKCVLECVLLALKHKKITEKYEMVINAIEHSCQ